MKIEEIFIEVRKNAYLFPGIKRKNWNHIIYFNHSHRKSLENILNCDLFADDWEIIYPEEL